MLSILAIGGDIDSAILLAKGLRNFPREQRSSSIKRTFIHVSRTIAAEMLGIGTAFDPHSACRIPGSSLPLRRPSLTQPERISSG
jgi:hypothetical protein